MPGNWIYSLFPTHPFLKESTSLLGFPEESCVSMDPVVLAEQAEVCIWPRLGEKPDTMFTLAASEEEHACTFTD